MQYRKMGRSELEVSPIGFGCWEMGGTQYGEVDDQEQHPGDQLARGQVQAQLARRARPAPRAGDNGQLDPVDGPRPRDGGVRRAVVDEDRPNGRTGVLRGQCAQAGTDAVLFVQSRDDDDGAHRAPKLPRGQRVRNYPTRRVLISPP